MLLSLHTQFNYDGNESKLETTRKLNAKRAARRSNLAGMANPQSPHSCGFVAAPAWANLNSKPKSKNDRLKYAILGGDSHAGDYIVGFHSSTQPTDPISSNRQ
jgi:hypothetical protein